MEPAELIFDLRFAICDLRLVASGNFVRVLFEGYTRLLRARFCIARFCSARFCN